MTSFNLETKGDFLFVESPDKRAFLLPYWLENRLGMAGHIQSDGPFAQGGAILISDKNVIDVRAYVRPGNFERLVGDVERGSNGAFMFEKSRAFDLHKFGKSETPLLSVKASMPAPLLPGFCQAAGLEGVRPFQDPHAESIIKKLGNAPMPA